jgi:hypothetical protein
VRLSLGGAWRQRHRREGTTGPFQSLAGAKVGSVGLLLSPVNTPTCAAAPPITTTRRI